MATYSLQNASVVFHAYFQQKSAGKKVFITTQKNRNGEIGLRLGRGYGRFFLYRIGKFFNCLTHTIDRKREILRRLGESLSTMEPTLALNLREYLRKKKDSKGKSFVLGGHPPFPPSKPPPPPLPPLPPQKPPEPNYTVPIDENVKKTLDQLCENSSYAIDSLPLYPIHPRDSPRRELMTAPVMKGVTQTGQGFLAICVDRMDSDPPPKGWYSKSYRDPTLTTHRKTLLILYQTDKKRPREWDQLCRENDWVPDFFTRELTHWETGERDPKQEKNFARVKELFQQGEAVDRRGRRWKIPLEVTPPPPPEVKIPPSIAGMINSLFTEKGNSVDSLPIYPVCAHFYPTLDLMTAPMMKGLLDDGRLFIAIALDRIDPSGKRQGRELLILYPLEKTSPLQWSQHDEMNAPRFFDKNFTDKGGAEVSLEEEGFHRLKAVFKQGRGRDKHGIEWALLL